MPGTLVGSAAWDVGSAAWDVGSAAWDKVDAMPLPRSIAHFNKRYTNRFIQPIVERASGFALVHHVGRSSGKPYTTPVNIFEQGDHFIVALTYGPSADWVKNVLAAPSSIELGETTHEVESARIVGRDVAWGVLPAFVRLILRAISVEDFLELTVRR